MSPGKLKIADIRHLNDLEKHEQEWDKLIEKCPGAVHTQSYAWINAFFHHSLHPDEKWICLFAYKNGKLVAVYPLMINRRIGFRGFCFQTFKTPYEKFHTIRVDGLMLPGHEDTLESLVNYLRRSFKAFPLIHLPGITGFSCSMLYFKNGGRKLSVYKKPDGAENFITLPESHQDYLSNLKSLVKKKIHRRLRKLESKAKISVVLRDIQRTNEENLEIFKEIESSGWKGARKTSIKLRPGDSELYLSATNKFHEKGWIRWSFLETNGETVAARLFTRINTTTVSWKTAYREDHSVFAPSKILFYRCIEDFYECGELGEINFMNVNTWFKDWNVNERPLYKLTVFPRSFFLSPLVKLYLLAKYG